MLFGSFSGIKLLAGRGPGVKIKISSIGNVETDLRSEFTSQGINQTLHRLYIDFRIDVILSLPLKSINVPVNCRYLLSEVVIVGDVPDAYTDINRTFDDITESEIDDINDFGAET